MESDCTGGRLTMQFDTASQNNSLPPRSLNVCLSEQSNDVSYAD